LRETQLQCSPTDQQSTEPTHGHTSPVNQFARIYPASPVLDYSILGRVTNALVESVLFEPHHKRAAIPIQAGSQKLLRRTVTLSYTPRDLDNETRKLSCQGF
jgi:hypothetical protein